MTDADKWELQRMLKESQEELQRLWNHNRALVEQLKALEGQKDASRAEHEGKIDSGLDPEKIVEQMMKKAEDKSGEFTEQLRANEKLQDAPVPPKEGKEPTDAFARLKKNYLALHAERTQLLEKLEERDKQLKELREEQPTYYPNVQRSLSMGEVLSPEDPRAEVGRLQEVLQDKEKKIHNLGMQLKSLEAAMSGGADHASRELIQQLQERLKAAEV